VKCPLWSARCESQVGRDDRVRCSPNTARSAGGARYLGEGAGSWPIAMLVKVALPRAGRVDPRLSAETGVDPVPARRTRGERAGSDDLAQALKVAFMITETATGCLGPLEWGRCFRNG